MAADIRRPETLRKALRGTGLEPYGVIWPRVEKLARKSKLRIVTAGSRGQGREAARRDQGIQAAPLDDLECFARTIERLESDLDMMKVRANAWAAGDVARLRELPTSTTQRLHRRGAERPVHAGARLHRPAGAPRGSVVAAVEEAMARNSSTVAVLSIDQIFKPDGYVAQLRAKGYVVEDP